MQGFPVHCPRSVVLRSSSSLLLQSLKYAGFHIQWFEKLAEYFVAVCTDPSSLVFLRIFFFGGTQLWSRYFMLPYMAQYMPGSLYFLVEGYLTSHRIHTRSQE